MQDRGHTVKSKSLRQSTTGHSSLREMVCFVQRFLVQSKITNVYVENTNASSIGVWYVRNVEWKLLYLKLEERGWGILN